MHFTIHHKKLYAKLLLSLEPRLALRFHDLAWNPAPASCPSLCEATPRTKWPRQCCKEVCLKCLWSLACSWLLGGYVKARLSAFKFATSPVKREAAKRDHSQALAPRHETHTQCKKSRELLNVYKSFIDASSEGPVAARRDQRRMRY